MKEFIPQTCILSEMKSDTDSTFGEKSGNLVVGQGIEKGLF